MNHINILKRAFNITINYRVLWIFGILLALTTGGGGGGGNGGGGGGGNGSSNGGNVPGYNGQNPFGFFPQWTPAMTSTIIALAVGFICLVLGLIAVLTIVRYVSETSVIRMVDKHENDGEKLGFRQAFRLGWSRAAWKLFLMDLLVILVFLFSLILLLVISALPLLVLLIKDATPLHIIGAVVSAGMFLLVLAGTIVVALALSLVINFAQRALVLEDLGIRESLKRGFMLVKAHPGDVILMGVMMFGIGLAWLLVSIPVILAVIIAGTLIGGLPALLVGSITNLFAQGALPWIAGIVVGLPIFLLVIIIPLLIFRGWQLIFSSTTWTLTYRETLALENLKTGGELPAPQAAPAA